MIALLFLGLGAAPILDFQLGPDTPSHISSPYSKELTEESTESFYMVGLPKNHKQIAVYDAASGWWEWVDPPKCKQCSPCPRLHTTHEEQAQVRGIMNGLNAKVEKGKR